jgi:hypothetical protein
MRNEISPLSQLVCSNSGIKATGLWPSTRVLLPFSLEFVSWFSLGFAHFASINCPSTLVSRTSPQIHTFDQVRGLQEGLIYIVEEFMEFASISLSFQETVLLNVGLKMTINFSLAEDVSLLLSGGLRKTTNNCLSEDDVF